VLQLCLHCPEQPSSQDPRQELEQLPEQPPVQLVQFPVQPLPEHPPEHVPEQPEQVPEHPEQFPEQALPEHPPEQVPEQPAHPPEQEAPTPHWLTHAPTQACEQSELDVDVMLLLSWAVIQASELFTWIALTSSPWAGMSGKVSLALMIWSSSAIFS
jgi:hypothetical protein